MNLQVVQCLCGNNLLILFQVPQAIGRIETKPFFKWRRVPRVWRQVRFRLYYSLCEGCRYFLIDMNSHGEQFLNWHEVSLVACGNSKTWWQSLVSNNSKVQMPNLLHHYAVLRRYHQWCRGRIVQEAPYLCSDCQQCARSQNCPCAAISWWIFTFPSLSPCLSIIRCFSYQECCNDMVFFCLCIFSSLNR
jgi:hypothetical protein